MNVIDMPLTLTMAIELLTLMDVIAMPLKLPIAISLVFLWQ